MRILRVMALSMLTLGVLPAGAQESTTGTAASAPSTDQGAVEIEGKISTVADITSFGLTMQDAGMQPLMGRELLDQYVLTKLYDQIETTASLEGANLLESPTPYPAVIQRNLLRGKLRDAIADTVEVPREEMEKWYEENVSRYQRPERVHALHLFMETSEDDPSSSTEKVRQRLTEIKAEIDAGTSFSEAAKKYSEAASREGGGVIGNVTRRMPIGPLNKPMNIELENVFFELEPHKVSDVVDTRHGMHLLYITEHQTTRTPSIDDLVSSGILPGRLAEARVAEEMQNLASEAISKYDGKAFPEGDLDGSVTSATVVFRFNDKHYTLGHLISVFGPRFESYVTSLQGDDAAIKELIKQSMDDEALLFVAMDRNLDKESDVAPMLEAAGELSRASRQIDAIAEAEAVVTDEMITAKYDELIDQLRQPEAEGWLLVIEAKQATGTAEQARARELAGEAAEKARERLATEDFEAVAASLLDSEDFTTTYSQITRHVIGRSTMPLERKFDQAISSIRGDTGLGAVVPLGAEYCVAKLDQKYLGEPVDLAVVRSRIVEMLQREGQYNARTNMVERLEEAGKVKFLPGAVQFGRGSAEAVEAAQ